MRFERAKGKNKKIYVVVILVFFLIGCQKQTGLNHNELLSGDFSSIVGEYVNSKGESIFLSKDIEDKLLENVSYADGYYFVNVDNDGYGLLLKIYSIGTEVTCYYDEYTTLTLNTDTSKIRICFGHSDPISNVEIYTKK